MKENIARNIKKKQTVKMLQQSLCHMQTTVLLTIHDACVLEVTCFPSCNTCFVMNIRFDFLGSG